MEQNDPGVKYERSGGRAKWGVPVFFVRPALPCGNSSRRYVGYDKLRKGIARWYGPKIIYFVIEGHVIGSNSEKNALREYWRICDKENIGKIFYVKPLQQHINQ